MQSHGWWDDEQEKAWRKQSRKKVRAPGACSVVAGHGELWKDGDGDLGDAELGDAGHPMMILSMAYGARLLGARTLLGPWRDVCPLLPHL